MTIRTSLAMVKLTSIVFVSAAIVFAMKYFDVQKQNQKLKATIELDKKTYTNELKEIFSRYDAELLLNQNLINSKASYIKNDGIYTGRELKNVGNPDGNVKPMTEGLFNKKIDSLKLILKNKSDENESLINQINALINKNKELQKQNSITESILAGSKTLTASNVHANGVRVVSSSIIETKRFSNTEQIKVCFTLLENKAALKGNKDVYVQVINPKNRVVSKNGAFVEIGDKSLYYSAKANILYNNKELDVCVLVDSNKSDVVKGDYEINIFSGTNRIGNTVFSLK